MFRRKKDQQIVINRFLRNRLEGLAQRARNADATTAQRLLKEYDDILDSEIRKQGGNPADNGSYFVVWDS